MVSLVRPADPRLMNNPFLERARDSGLFLILRTKQNHSTGYPGSGKSCLAKSIWGNALLIVLSCLADCRLRCRRQREALQSDPTAFQTSCTDCLNSKLLELSIVLQRLALISKDICHEGIPLPPSELCITTEFQENRINPLTQTAIYGKAKRGKS